MLIGYMYHASKMARGKEQSEAEFLAEYDATVFERPSVAVDIVLLTTHEGSLRAPLLRRADHPFRDHWSLPGAFVGIEESLERAAARALAQKLGLEHVFLEQLFSFGDPRRDPRTRVISVSYYALVDHARLEPHLTTRADLELACVDVPWEGETGGAVELRSPEGGKLDVAFDHEDIVGMAVKRIRGKLDYTPIGFQLLPDEFTLRQLQGVHETVLGRPLNKDSFRRRMLASGLLEATGERQRDVGHRPAELYRFSKRSAV